MMKPVVLQKQAQPALQGFVKGYWYIRVQSKVTLLPMPFAAIPEQCLYFYPKERPTAEANNRTFTAQKAIINGQQISRHTLFVPNDYLMFKVIFQPSGLFRLFGVPMTLFADKFEDLTLVLGKEIKEVKEKIEETEDFDVMVATIEAFLSKKAVNGKVEERPIDAVIPLMHSNPHFSLDKLADDACLSSRQFERKFLERTGVTPKLYQRLIRFNQAMKLRQQFPTQSWLKIAYDCGYFDQMHLLRDFKQFTGEVPTSFDFENAIIY